MKFEIRHDEVVSLRKFVEAVEAHAEAGISEETRNKIDDCRKFLEERVRAKDVIYGVTTGFGPMAGTYISPENARRLQRQLIRMVSTGVGDPFDEQTVLAIMLARLINLSKGFSGIRSATVDLLAGFVNNGIFPFIPRYGTVGASGDLSPLAQMSLALMGEGYVFYKGEKRKAAEVLDQLGIKSLEPEAKEGLALINGTSVMTAVAAMNGMLAGRALKVATVLSMAYAEIFEARSEAFDPLFASVRPHEGQVVITDWINSLAGSGKRLSSGDNSDKDDKRPVQDVYSIRCIPQVYGAVYDTLQFHNKTVETELNAVTDNPLIFPDEEKIISGGNFMGNHIGLVSDALSNAVITLANHAERKIARIVDPLLNQGLPPYLQPLETGINSGFMSAQVSATSVLGLMRSKAHPASIQSIPTNGNNQDVVSMGTIAAQNASEHVGYLFQLLAIESLVMAQAVELLGGSERESDFCDATRNMLSRIRELSPFVKEDRPLYEDIAAVAEFLSTSSLEREIDGWLASGS